MAAEGVSMTKSSSRSFSMMSWLYPWPTGALLAVVVVADASVLEAPSTLDRKIRD